MIKGQYQKIVKNRSMIETLVLGTFLKSLTLYSEYKLTEKDFIIPKVKFFFTLGKAMSKSYSELDMATVLDFITNNLDFKSKYEDFGGWDSLSKAISFGNEKNIVGYIENLAKNNYLIYLDSQNIDMSKEVEIDNQVFSPLNDLFKDKTCRDIQEYYEGVLAKGAVDSINSNLKIESLILTKNDRKKLKAKEEAGIPYNIMFKYTEKEIGVSDSEEEKFIYGMPILSNKTNGLGNGGGITTIAGFSGIGKSTLTFLNIVVSLVYQGEKVVIFSNEQKSQYFKSILTSFVAYNVFGYTSLRRTDIDNGDWDKEADEVMDKVEIFLKNRHFEENLKFVHLDEFNIQEIIRMSKGLVAHQGFTTVLIDTFKSENSSNANYTGQIVENSKDLDGFGNKYNIKIIITMQLMPSNENKNAYLSGADLSECKAVKHVCDVLCLMRKVVNYLELDEDNKRYYLKPYRLKYNPLTKSWNREEIILSDNDKKKEYRILFLDKSRRGSDNLILLLRFNGSTGRFHEVGYVGHVSRGQLTY